jgi:hypothetical protein
MLNNYCPAPTLNNRLAQRPKGKQKRLIIGINGAYNLLQKIGDETVVSGIQRFNDDTGKFENASYLNGQLAGVNFPIKTGAGYFIYMKRM